MCADTPPEDPTDPDPNTVAAHVYLTEILTRVSTQRLHFSEGDEKGALDSLYELFGLARKVIADNAGCVEFSEKTVAFLNGEFRGFMAKWHRKRLEGELDTRDGAVEFRTALRGIQDEFRDFATVLHRMAYRTDLPVFPADRMTPGFPDAPLVYGIPKDDTIPKEAGDKDPKHIVDRINASETAAIEKRRALYETEAETTTQNPQVGNASKTDDKKTGDEPLELSDVSGLALSGGGIRSASFSLGVAQVLAENEKIMNSIDLMSTVSGGGFTGAFLARRIAESGTKEVANPEGPDTEAVKYLRKRANYLITGNTLKTIGLIFNLLAGMVLNWTAPAALIAVLVSMMHLVDVFEPPTLWVGLVALVFLGIAALTKARVSMSVEWIRDFGIWVCSLVAVGLLAIVLVDFDYVSLVMFSAVSVTLAFLAYAWLPYELGKLRPVVMWVFGLASVFLLGLIVVHWGYVQFVDMVENGGVGASVSIATIAAALPALSRVLPMLGKPWVRMIGNRIVMIIASIAVPVLALMFGYALYYLGTSKGIVVSDWAPDAKVTPGLFVLMCIAGVLVVTALIAAVLPALSRVLPMLDKPKVRGIANRIVMIIASILAPLLALMFGYALYYLGTSKGIVVSDLAPDAKVTPGLFVLMCIAGVLVATALAVININVTGPHWLYREQLAKSFVRLNEDGTLDVPLSDLDPDQRAPYLLLNAVVNLPNSEAIEMRERRGDFFVFSKNWCGSPVTGYRRTANWRRWYQQEIDLATAVATSGAAVAPHMALLSMSSARALLSFLNIRLGFWVRRPDVNQDGPEGTGGRPGAWMLLREMFGFGLDEHRQWLMLTDGAHLENSAIYELLRRRCKFIVAVDASAEAAGGFSTILTVVRHAAVDFGVRIHTDLKELRADPDTGMSRAHGVLCEIDYPAVDGKLEGKGLLLIIKLSMTGNESELINAYRHAYPAFPNVSTADQFFDEHQFEAFRELGVHAAKSLLKPALVGEGRDVDSVGDWLTRLYQRIPPERDG
ncbi:patatin-like phospholipase family protein [Tateyamaria armeniaca]|uniref:Patatin-like phospholipase family protein n=1 Tax=Tateyamaria armeniaca TaxID=2518930 RepID=A0ABW8UYD2_9RHOB